MEHHNSVVRIWQGTHAAAIYMVAPSPSLEVVTPEKTNKFDDVMHMQESARKVRKPTSQAVLSRMQLALHATRRTPFARRCALGTRDVCLIDENPTCSVPEL